MSELSVSVGQSNNQDSFGAGQEAASDLQDNDLEAEEYKEEHNE